MDCFDSHTVTGVTDKYEVCSNAYVLLVIIYGGKIVETGRLDLKKKGSKIAKLAHFQNLSGCPEWNGAFMIDVVPILWVQR